MDYVTCLKLRGKFPYYTVSILLLWIYSEYHNYDWLNPVIDFHQNFQISPKRQRGWVGVEGLCVNMYRYSPFCFITTFADWRGQLGWQAEVERVWFNPGPCDSPHVNQGCPCSNLHLLISTFARCFIRYFIATEGLYTPGFYIPKALLEGRASILHKLCTLPHNIITVSSISNGCRNITVQI